MSCTEIYSFDKNGVAHLYGTVRNSFRGGMAIWSFLEEKYLPPYIPEYAKMMGIKTAEQFSARYHYTPHRTSSFSEEALQDIWDLYEKDNVTMVDKICLCTTFDKCLIKKENIPQVVEAFRAFEGDTSLKEQAEILEELLTDNNCIAVGWNQTSVNGSPWINYGEENDRPLPYNCLTGDKHFWLFDELQETRR